jgi:hypothetical protein
MENFIKDLKAVRTLGCIFMDNESHLKMEFRADVEDYNVDEDAVNIYCDKGTEINLPKSQCKIIHDDEGYIFEYEKYTLMLMVA